MAARTIEMLEKDSNQFALIENDLGQCRISLYGGHIMSFIPKSDGRERLWVSPLASLNGERPIRGGIPLCWPWFSDDHGKPKGALPSHGFLRTQQWHIESVEDHNDQSTTVVLKPTTSVGKGFANACIVRLKVTVADRLTVVLQTVNTDDSAFNINCALHTYFAIENIKATQLDGLTTQYRDKLDNWEEKPTPLPYTFSAETDRIHLEAPKLLTIVESNGAKTGIESLNHDSIVVWNPWQGAASMSDMDAFGYRQMLCVETAVTNGITLQPGASHQLTQIIS